MRPLRVAVIGAGHLGRLHAQKLRQQPGASLVAVVDPLPEARERLAAEHDVPPLADHRQAVEWADAAVVAVPTALHRTVAVDLLAAGMHLLVEKPLASTLAEADELVAAARQHGALLQVGHVERFNPAVAAALPHLHDPRYIEATRTSTFSGRSTDIGAVLDLMIHDIDLALALARSDVVRIEALGLALLGRREDVAQARLTFASGCVADLRASRVSYIAQRTLHVWTEDGFAALDLAARTATLVRPCEAIRARAYDVEQLPVEERMRVKEHLFEDLLRKECLAVESADAIAAEQADFVESIQQLRPPRVGGEQGREALAVAERIVEAIAAQSAGRLARGEPDQMPRVIPAPHWSLRPAAMPRPREAG
jgi:predicted dehydrogenase